MNTFLQIFHVDNIQFMFCLRFSSKIFKTITNINSISYNFLFFHIFFNLSNLLTKQKLHMLEKIKIKREASLLFFLSENLFHQSGNEKSTEVGIPTSVDWEFTERFFQWGFALQWLDRRGWSPVEHIRNLSICLPLGLRYWPQRLKYRPQGSRYWPKWSRFWPLGPRS